MDNRIKKIMSIVFEVPVEKIYDKSSPENIEAWDSLRHMNLVVALEEEFDIEFNDDEILLLVSFIDIKKLLIKYLKTELLV